ncbi:MAG: hypothetical protein LQ352_005286 [Teloschistes flavicans]|nr:MAG: hypothetical protein LQ352_005286 [Teloschistes flavicans]
MSHALESVPNSEDARGETDDIEEDDMQSLIGVSISPIQTRLRSPSRPVVQRAAVLDKYGRNGVFEPYSWTEDRQSAPSQALHYEQRPRAISSPDAATSPKAALPDKLALPSPWIAAPKVFERQTTHPSKQEQPGADSRAHNGPVTMLADLRIKKLVSSLSFPALPKPPAMRDLQLPSLPNLVGVKAKSQASTTLVSRSRASTLDLTKPSWSPNTTPPPARRQPSARNHGTQGSDKHGTQTINLDELEQNQLDGLSNTHDDKGHSPEPLFKRSTSDQSLLLRRVSSLASSLGDDSRWANVQKQVNSRAKAITDSFQDSTIRLPSLPSLPNVSLFKPDFLRNRAASDAPQPTNEQSSKSRAVHETQQDLPDAPYSLLDRALESLTGDIVVLGGYRGSILRSATPPHRQLWVPVKVGLNIRKVNLEVGLEVEDELIMEETIIPSGMLSHIGPIDMGRRLLKRMRACRNTREGKLRVHDYGYDWRLSPHLLSQKLIGYLEHLSEGLRERRQGAIVIAHSLGGLITRHAVNRRPDLFAGILYAGVPQHCINVLGPLRNGDEVLLSSKVLTAQVNFTLRTSFLLLPDSGRCFVDKKSKEEYLVNFFDVADWKRYAFSPCIASASPPFANPIRKGILASVADSLPSLPFLGRGADHIPDRGDPVNSGLAATLDPDPHLEQQSLHSSSKNGAQSTIPLAKAEEYLKRTLADTLRFKEELKFNKDYSLDNRYPPLSILYGTSVPTVSRARVASRAAIKCRDTYDDLEFASGDGVCLARAAMLPPGYECVTGGKVRTQRGHVGLLGDLDAVGKCLVSIIEGRKKGVGLGPEPESWWSTVDEPQPSLK